MEWPLVQYEGRSLPDSPLINCSSRDRQFSVHLLDLPVFLCKKGNLFYP